MADVGRAHGGDCNYGGGGDHPDGRDHRRLPSNCEASGGSSSDGQRGRRGKTRQLGLDKIIAARKDVPLDIAFEQGKHDTYKPVGNNGKHFSSLVGSIVDRLPMNIQGWAQVPQSFKDALFIELREYFDMAPWLDGPSGGEFKNGIDRYCGDRYRDHKFRFKERYFDALGGEDAVDIRDRRPPGMDELKWNEHVDFYTSPGMTKRSKANKANKARQQIKGHGGRYSFAQLRHMSRDPDSDDSGSAIDSYRRLYTDTNGNFVQDEPGRRYAEMVALRDAQRGVEEPLSDAQIMRQVLGPRPGWERGIGPKLPSSSQPPFQTQGSQRFFSQAEVEEMITTRLAENQKKQQQQQRQWQKQMKKEMQAYMKGNAGTSQPEEEENEGEEEENEDEEEESEDEEEDRD